MSFAECAAGQCLTALLCSNSGTLAKILKAEITMSTVNKKCWSAEFLGALHGLKRSCDYQRRVKILQTIPQSEFVDVGRG